MNRYLAERNLCGLLSDLGFFDKVRDYYKDQLDGTENADHGILKIRTSEIIALDSLLQELWVRRKDEINRPAKKVTRKRKSV